MAQLICKYDSSMIIVMAIVNVIVFMGARVMLKSGNALLNPTGNKRFNVKANMVSDGKTLFNIQRKRNTLLTFYTVYANLTAIFPLLGILGTVAALTTYSEDENMMENLMVALDTTLLGVLFAIIFKILDSFISARIDAFVDDADYEIRKFDGKGEIDNEI